MKRRWWALAALLGSVLIVAGWIAFLAVIGLDRADQLSSVVGAILAAVFGMAGVVVAVRTWPRSAPSGENAPAIQINQASGGATVYGVQGGNLVAADPGPASSAATRTEQAGRPGRPASEASAANRDPGPPDDR